MSWDYTYYIGYKDKDDKVYPFAPYDKNGELHCVRSVSRSFTSDLHESFYPFTEDNITDELVNDIHGDCGATVDELRKEMVGFGCGYLPVKELPHGSIMKTGYFLIDDIKEYLEDHSSYDLFFDHLSSEEYSMRLDNELKLGSPEKEDERSMRDYAFFSYEDENSKEYEAFVLRRAAHMFEFAKLPEGAELVIIMTQG